MKTLYLSPLKSTQQGIVLIEAMIAILIFSFAILGIIGLQAAMVKNTSDSKYRADASHIAQQLIGAMWTDPVNISSYLQNNTDISNLLPQGTFAVSQPVATVSQYVVTVTWQEPGQAQHKFTTMASISGQ